ncbi:autotransporter domain-containing protein [Pusillimonas sp.]|uniref:autotransporter domain-containing protein n=1 Tax=Pusillimonas sp. TaxID=3040095 RepID=UPI0029B56BCF|nr:autotransporter domain-containing protein [Pusillimonas sp.]MDX3895304.1 autotransporter domain-containing protein [Pusillimonas sp.]
MASAPFVFEGDVLRIETPGWESDRDYLIDASAYIEVADGIDAHLRGNIGAAFGSPNGLYKLGAGTLRLSGSNSYRGSTRLLQGGLHVDGPSVFGLWGGIEAIRGTRLEYSAGVDVARPLTLSGLEIADMLPASRYTPVTPPAGMEQVVGWKVEAGRAVHSGLLQGSAPFVKLGNGVLDITGDAMAYTGAARVAQGTLAINEIFSGSVRVQTGARLEGAGSVAAVQVGPGGTLAPGNGSGMTANETSVLSPDLDLADLSSRLREEGTLFLVSSDSASGRSGMDLTAEAGKGVGTLVVAGDIRFEPGSRFEIDALPTGESDFAWAGGKAVLDGEVAVLARNGLWQAGTSYAVLTARGGFGDSEFASVSSDLAFLTPGLSYSDDTVTLTLLRNDLPIDDVGETPDEEEVGKIIDEDVPPPGSDPDAPKPPGDLVDNGGTDQAPPKSNPELNESVVGLDKDSARDALRQLTGSWNASVLSSVWDDSRFLREAVLRRAMTASRSSSRPTSSTAHTYTFSSRGAAKPSTRRISDRAFLSPSALASDTPTLKVASTHEAAQPSAEMAEHSSIASAAPTAWVEVFHSDQVRDGRDGIPGDTRRLDGVVLGIAAAVNASWNAGAYLGAQRSRLDRDEDLARADIESTHAGLHLAGHIAGLRLALGAARSWHRFKSSRFVNAGALRDTLAARYRGHTTQVFGEAAWPLTGVPSTSVAGESTGEPVAGASRRQTLHRVSITPFARLAWVRTGLDGFVETGGPAALNVRPASMTAWLSTLGLRAEAGVQALSSGPATGQKAAGNEGTIYAQLAWHHAGRSHAESTQSFRDSATQTLFTSQGLAAERRSWSLQLGLDARVGKTANVGFAYLGRFGPGLRDQGVGGWARIAF